MSQCSLYFPGLLGPDVPLEVLDQKEWPGVQQIPNLVKLLSRGHFQVLNKADIETRILKGMGVSFCADEDLPIARLRTRQRPQLEVKKRVWCLDPVFIRVDKEDAVVCAHEEIELIENEARHIIDDLNAHFVEDGFKLHYHSVYCWVLEADLELKTTSLYSALHQNISRLQPTGTSEKRWRALLNEIQMLLHSHPVNQAREARGDALVNSVWLWGGGQAEDYEPQIDSIYCDLSWVNDLAQSFDLNSITIDKFPTLTKQTGSSLLVYSEAIEAIRRNDAFAWLDALKMFEEKILAVAIKLLADGEINELSVYSDTISVSMQKKDLNKWWKRVKPIRDIILTTRKAYGF